MTYKFCLEKLLRKHELEYDMMILEKGIGDDFLGLTLYEVIIGCNHLISVEAHWQILTTTTTRGLKEMCARYQ